MSGRRRRRDRRRQRRHAVSRSRRAELQFPVSRVERLLREGRYARRLSTSTPVFLTAVLEYLTANILELAGKEALDSHKMRITPEHVQRALGSNQHLRGLLENTTSPRVDGMPRVRKW
ncbi:histone H2A-Bbd type 1-like isoform X2 [Leopardus geoffroyi]|uniref:histone H2A-Bbd type 1-like isoform X2 n=1 Tax=Leopardus geoffroyi TaxID=46844 RepID=UPI001E2661FB|nr:histone H2A-Bbd type 1-like isoform X2 [Leopardus geoffroyi]